MVKNRITYIAGPISHTNKTIEKANLKRFFDKEEELLAEGRNVHNPARFEGETPRMSWEYFLSVDLLFLVQNQPAMYFLTGWKSSKGARLEHEMGKLLGVKLEYEKEGE